MRNKKPTRRRECVPKRQSRTVTLWEQEAQLWRKETCGSNCPERAATQRSRDRTLAIALTEHNHSDWLCNFHYWFIFGLLIPTCWSTGGAVLERLCNGKSSIMHVNTLLSHLGHVIVASCTWILYLVSELNVCMCFVKINMEFEPYGKSHSRKMCSHSKLDSNWFETGLVECAFNPH